MIALNRFDFSFADYQRFLTQCPFTDEEIEILNLRRKGKSVIQISFETNLSDRTVSRRLRSIERKISKEI